MRYGFNNNGYNICIHLQIGVSAFVGVAFVLAFIPLQAYLGKLSSSLLLTTALRTDDRVSLMNEIIQGIQVIKMNVWEKSFAKKIDLSRK